MMVRFEGLSAEAEIDTSLTIQRNRVHDLRTVERVAKDLGAYEDLIYDLVLDLEPRTG